MYMTATNPFVLERTDYKRDINVVKHYIDDSAQFLHKMRGIPLDQAVEFVKKTIGKNGAKPFKDPVVNYLQRNEWGDREEKQGTMSEFLKDSIEKQEIITAPFTTYCNPNFKKSILAEYIDKNVALRGKAKKAKFAAEMSGDVLLAAIQDSEQSNKKTFNNSISGGHVSPTQPLYNRTAHASLTSNCRITSGNGNANNEKFLCGNRHYWKPEIALNNIVSITNHSDYVKIAKIVDKYNLHIPTVDDVMDCITYSSNLYWRNIEAISLIKEYVSKLNDLERVAFVYTSDLYHLAKHNPDLVKTFLNKLAKPVYDPCENPKDVLKQNREEYTILASQFFPDEMRGFKIKDVEDKPIHEAIASTVLNIHHTLLEYGDLIDGLWVTENMPVSLAALPDSVRRAALASDTDSTIFTVQDWVFWMYGHDVGFNQNTFALSATMIFLAAETITHILAKMSANFGIGPERIFQIAMKNEYKFDVFIPTNVGKHYFAYIGCQEGNLYAKFKPEIKGVHLISSNVASSVMADAKKMMIDIMETVLAGKKIDLKEMLVKVANIEREINRSIVAGEPTYLRRGSVKEISAYSKSAEESPYQHYTFWQEVMAKKYGDSPPPPYSCYKINVSTSSPTKIKKWIENIKDRELAARLEKWINLNGKSSVKQFLLPQVLVASIGIPEELAMVMDNRKAIYDIVHVFYIILETVGFYCSNDKNTYLVSDEY